MSFFPGPYDNGKWEVVGHGGYRYYHDPCTVHLTPSGKELRKYLTGYPGGPDWSFRLPEAFVKTWEERGKDELLWCKARKALETEGWHAAQAIIEPVHGWVEHPSELDYWSCRLLHSGDFRQPGWVMYPGKCWFCEDPRTREKR